MAKLSQKEIAALWIREGGNPAKADEASAVAMAESGGDSQAGNSCCHGLYAFNVEVGVTSMKCALNIQCATRKAINMSKQGKDWTPWEAWTNGSYLQFVGKSGFPPDKKAAEEHLKQAVRGGIFSGVLGEESAVGGAIHGVQDVFESPLKGLERLAAAVEAIARLIEDMFTAHFWVRFGKGLLGALLLVYALQGILKATLGMEIPIGAFNSRARSMAAELAGKGG